MARQVGTFALVPQVVDAVKVPVIAPGIGDARGIVASLRWVLRRCRSAPPISSALTMIPAVHLQALKSAEADDTMVTNVFTGRPARGIVNRVMREVGPLSPWPRIFRSRGGALAPLKPKDKAADFTNLWSGQAAPWAANSQPAS